MEVVGNPGRSAVLRVIVTNPGLFYGQIAEQLPELPVPTMATHLRVLERVGCISLDVPPGNRRGRAPRYTANVDRIEQLVSAWVAYMTDAGPQAT